MDKVSNIFIAFFTATKRTLYMSWGYLTLIGFAKFQIVTSIHVFTGTPACCSLYASQTRSSRPLASGCSLVSLPPALVKVQRRLGISKFERVISTLLLWWWGYGTGMKRQADPPSTFKGIFFSGPKQPCKIEEKKEWSYIYIYARWMAQWGCLWS